jgi:hypothetical protein
MLMAGKNITQANDPLVKVTPEYLFHAVKNPKPTLESAIRTLRQVKSLDEKRYQVLKRELPYTVSSVFHPAVRRTENFAWTNHFMADIDHLSVKETTPTALKQKLMADSRVLLMFASPGNDGLKILFRLSEKFFDHARYSWFYKAFIADFSKQYNLQQVADTRTSDVTRACFISHDPEAFYNENAEPVNSEKHISFDNHLDFKQRKTEIEKEQKSVRSILPSDTEKAIIEPDALEKIKATLNPRLHEKQKKQIFVPSEAEEIVEKVAAILAEKQIVTTEVISIHYGKKFRFALGARLAEINLFYGKRGYTAVISPRNGTNTDLNQVCWQLITEMFE